MGCSPHCLRRSKGTMSPRQNMETQTKPISPQTLKRIGIAADHGGFELKEFLAVKLRAAGFEITDFGDAKLSSDDDCPDFIIPLAKAVAAGTVDRGVGICGSGVGASIAANKVAGVIGPLRIWSSTCIATAPASSNSSCTCRRMNSESDFSNALMSRTRIGNSASPTFTSGNIGNIICMLLKIA